MLYSYSNTSPVLTTSISPAPVTPQVSAFHIEHAGICSSTAPRTHQILPIGGELAQLLGELEHFGEIHDVPSSQSHSSRLHVSRGGRSTFTERTLVGVALRLGGGVY